MRILVTGGAGYIGSVVTERLLQQGHTVVVLDDLSTGHRGAVHPDAHFAAGDIRDRAFVDQLLGRHPIDGAIHMAAKALIPESITDPAPFYSINLGGSLTLLDALRAHSVRKIVFSSTAAVFGEPQQLPIDESHPVAPMNSYGDSKLAFERALHWYSGAYGIEATVFRYFSAAGASDRFGEAHVPETHLLPRFLDAAATGATALIYGDDYDTPDGTCIRDFIHVIDIADAHIRALATPNPDRFRIFNLGSGTGYSVRDVLRVVGAVTGRPLRSEVRPRRAGDPARLVAGSAKAMRELHWQPQFPQLEPILASAWKWHRAHPQGYAA